MIRKFLNRENELDLLNKLYNKSGFKLFLLYGRRRVGKTELIKEFIKDKPSFYLLADKRGTQRNVERMTKSISVSFNDFEPKINEFDNFFEYIYSKIGDEKYIVVLDEFPYLIEKDDSIPSVFQIIVDEVLVNSNILLIITGSNISMMEDLLSSKSPLYGRRTASLKLEAFPFYQLKLFFPNYDILELIKMYSILGGTPYYCSLMDSSLSVIDNLEENVLVKSSVLFREVEFLLRFEFRETAIYESILEAMSTGLTSSTKIANHAGINAKDIAVYLKILRNLRIIRKEVPITEKLRSRKSQYFVEDNFFQFWFKFIKPLISNLEIGEIDDILESISSNFDEYIGKQVFKGLSEELVDMLNSQKKLPFKLTKLGRWWSGKHEIDIVGINDKTKEILFVECKWQEKVNAKDILYKLKDKTIHVNWNLKDRTEYYCIIAKSFKDSSLNDPPTDVSFFSLKDFEQVFL